MNDLDRKIAELKGWEYVPASGPIFPGGKMRLSEGYGEVVPGHEEKWFHLASECNWSTSDSKALELVDEMTIRDEICGFELFLLATVPKRIWKAQFHVHGDPRQIPAVAESRPEAICRAYIACREWMAKEGGKG